MNKIMGYIINRKILNQGIKIGLVLFTLNLLFTTTNLNKNINFSIFLLGIIILKFKQDC